jgi:hypothetical protein
VEVRFIAMLKQMFGPIACSAVQHDAVAYSQPLAGAPGDGLPPSTVPNYQMPTIVLADCHTFRDGDVSTPGFYVGLGNAPGSIFMPGILSGNALLQASNADPTRAIQLYRHATLGLTVSVLPDADPYHWDNVSTVTVDVATGPNQAGLENATVAACEEDGANAILIGDEIIQFTTAAFQGFQPVSNAARYILSGLLRGRVGTEPYTTGHLVGEKVMLLNDAVMRARIEPSSVGVTSNYVLSLLLLPLQFHQKAGFVPNLTYKVDGWSLKPYAPDGPTRIVQSNGDVLFKWWRRTRYLTPYYSTGVATTALAPGDLQSFDLEIWDATETNLLREITTSSEEFLYTVAMQTADGVDNTDSVVVKSYQRTSILTPVSPDGRGYEARALLPLGVS